MRRTKRAREDYRTDSRLKRVPTEESWLREVSEPSHARQFTDHISKDERAIAADSAGQLRHAYSCRSARRYSAPLSAQK